MRQYKILGFSILFSLSTNSCFAALSFSEIMYDPMGSDSGREWVEVRNDGDALSLASYKFFENNTNHSLSSVQGGVTIASGGYAVIADNAVKFLEDNPGFSGQLFDSVFSLSNAGEFISLKDSSGNTIDSVSYSPSLGGSDDGTTLSKLETEWVRGDPTPGALSVVSTKSTSTKETAVTPKDSSPSMDINLFLPEEVLMVAGADKDISVEARNSSLQEPTNMTYEWSFGDGGFRTGKSVSYHYIEPGIYLAIVEAHNANLFAKGRLKVRVVEPKVRLTSFIKNDRAMLFGIANDSKHEIDMSGWKIGVDTLRYTLPKNTVILPGVEVTLNGLELGMSTSTMNASSSSLYFPSGQEVSSSSVKALHSKQEDMVRSQEIVSSAAPLKVVTAKYVPSTIPAVKPVMTNISSSTKTSLATTKKEIKKETNIADFFKRVFSDFLR